MPESPPSASVVYIAVSPDPNGAAALAAWERTVATLMGGWDAWAIWNLRARFLARPTLTWTNAFAPETRLVAP